MSTPSSALLPPDVQILLQTMEDRLNNYIEAMSPGVRITNVDGSFQQRQLWIGVIKFLLEQPPQIFIAGWGLFLKKVLEHRQGCFSPMYINRFREELKLPLEERRNYERMIHLAYTTCDTRSRVLSMKQIDMNQILSMLPREDQRQKIIAFYQL
jgi:hypothetical protein